MKTDLEVMVGNNQKAYREAKAIEKANLIAEAERVRKELAAREAAKYAAEQAAYKAKLNKRASILTRVITAITLITILMILTVVVAKVFNDIYFGLVWCGASALAGLISWIFIVGTIEDRFEK